MKLPTRLVAGLGIMMIISASPLLHADDRDQGHGGEYHQGDDHGHNDNHDNHDNRGPGGRPPQNFDHERQTFHDRHEYFTRGRDLPPNYHLERGRPLPRGYGDRMDPRALEQLPRYDGYEWRRVGPDVVLVAITTGVIYTILDNVLN
ncbi:anti-virulence regulator CigR family protein [Pseudomonas sp. CCI3.2]|uniref:anti-virulence regulator CigR family protein n=1 Tax=unclassified Pseudomonas TaxID=196821 RepID=UPI002AC8EA49|nr:MULTISPECIES: anti-virulence regulator CigR family protein [unclassified Pseudomonas]MEB0078388.1 anti-virulence regulator CigR family protein [Pseudomonas sp. MH10out]MEB0100258.1 anti-virulence regulator CigR family protein [Pseudomonas sp. CCI3.2]MEB0130156.1 anti-virulence regulator CigR family protein [Pseudomonas sp. CCI2.4]MEB0157588.1 anti-virulence regulator CigR family protein [Pseudomonas sp. AH2 (2023)]MEB0168842.1 anti-virulence regulator CigR family protein [Pseudomonas sp. CC